MNPFQEFLNNAGKQLAPGEEEKTSGWLHFCEFEVKSGRVCICDPVFPPPYMELTVSVNLPPGLYRVEGRGSVMHLAGL